MKNNMKKALVIIPTYNERKNIVSICERIISHKKVFEILIVDDNSPDGTGKLADNLAAHNEKIHVLHGKKKSGLGTAYIKGFTWGLERDYDLFFEIDADFSHNPDDLVRLLNEMDDCDLCIGSRYIDGGGIIDLPLWRMILSKFAARYYTRIITGMPVHDTTAGFKCFRRNVLESIDLNKVHSEGYAFQIEMHYRVWKRGFRIKEIPIIFTAREQGKSKMSNRIIMEAIFMVWKIKHTVQ
jgi:dolichol-phosphate mannosyltransferase